MTTPTVETRATSTHAPATTSHSVTMPSGITVGDLLVVAFSFNAGTIATASASSDWTELEDSSVVSSGPSLAIFYKIAEGSDALTVTTSTGASSSCVALRISDASDIEVASSPISDSSSTNADPPSISPDADAQDYLFIAVMAAIASSLTAGPSGYSNFTTVTSTGTSVTSSNVATAEKETDAQASENPGAFTSALDPWIAQTIAIWLDVRPAFFGVGF